MTSMIATSASHQSSSSAPSALSKFTTRDKLLLAQAVHELGTSPPDWGKVAGLMLAHPLVREPARLEEVHAAGITIGRVFGTRECERAWTALMRQRGLIVDPSEAAALHRSAAVQARNRKEARGAPPRMDKRSMLVLAQLLYAERMEEIKRNIKDKEVQYRELVSELEDLNSGKLDDRIAAELRGEIAAAPLRKRAQQPTNAAASAEITQSSLSPSAPISAKPIQAQKARASISDVETSPTSTKTKAADPPHGTQSAASSSAAAVAVADDDVAGKEEGSKSGPKEKLRAEDAVDIAASDGAHAQVHDEDATMEDATVSAKEENEEQAASSPAAETKTPISTPTKTSRAVGKRKRGGDEEDREGADEAEEPAPDTKSGRPKSKRARSDMPTEPATTEVTEVDDDVDEQAEEESPEKSASRASNNAPRRTRRTTRGAPEDEEAEAEQAPPSEIASPARRKSRSRRNVSQEASTIPDTGEDGDEHGEEEQDEGEEDVDEAEHPGNSSGEDEEDNPRSRATSPASSRAGVEGATPASSTRSGRVRGAPGRRQRGVSNASSTNVQTPAVKTRAKRDPASGRKTRGEAKEKDKANTSVESVDKDDRKGKRKTSEKVLLMLLQEVANHMHGNLFQGPIKDQDAPDYYSVIRDPWDLRRIKTAIKAGEILSALELHRKLNIMFANALMYNRPGTEMHRMAKEMWESTEEAMQRFCA